MKPLSRKRALYALPLMAAAAGVWLVSAGMTVAGGFACIGAVAVPALSAVRRRSLRLEGNPPAPGRGDAETAMGAAGWAGLACSLVLFLAAAPAWAWAGLGSFSLCLALCSEALLRRASE